MSGPSVAELRAVAQPHSTMERNSGEHWAGVLYMRKLSIYVTWVLAKTPITPKPVGALDGVESDGSGGFIVTDFRAAKVLHITPKGEVHDLKQLSGSAADLAVVPGKRMLIVPDLQGNAVSAYDAGMNIR